MKVKAKTQYKSQYQNPIQLREGEWVEVGQEDEQYPGWTWTITNDENSGWAPTKILTRQDKKAVVMEDYSAKELTTHVDEILTIHKILNGWYLVENQSKEIGWVPIETVEAIERQ